MKKYWRVYNEELGCLDSELFASLKQAAIKRAAIETRNYGVYEFDAQTDEVIRVYNSDWILKFLMAEKKVESILSVLTSEQKQLLKDTIKYGCWGDSEYEFLDENGKPETVSMMGYCTNDAKLAGNFSGRKVSAMFRSIYQKLCPERYNQVGRYISHCRDWWGDGSGDMLFIRHSMGDDFEMWAKC